MGEKGEDVEDGGEEDEDQELEVASIPAKMFGMGIWPT